MCPVRTLQDQSRYRYAAHDPDVAGLLVTELELAADFTMNDAVVMGCILVAGESLGAYHALSVLEAKGASDKTRFVAAAAAGTEEGGGGGGAGRPPVVALLHEAAAAAGVALPQPERLEVAAMALLQQGGQELHATATLVDPANPGPREELPVDLLVGCEPPSVSRALFSCLNDASLVFDGRLVVDGAFRTNDPNVYAGGTVAKLSRRYGGVHLERYNSRDVGRCLAGSLAARFAAASGAAAPASEQLSSSPPPPVLRQARVVGCGLPGGANFMFAGTPSALEAPSLAPPAGGLSMHTRTERGYTLLNLDADGAVHSITYLGRVAVPAARLGALVGLHGNYLNQLAPRYAAGEVPDLLTFLVGDGWSELLFHDGFGELREQLLEAALASVAVAGADVQGGLVELVTQVRAAAAAGHAHIHGPPSVHCDPQCACPACTTSCVKRCPVAVWTLYDRRCRTRCSSTCGQGLRSCRPMPCQARRA